MIKKSLFFAAAVALSFVGQAKADYVLSLSGLNPTTLNANGTVVNFAIPAATQNGQANFAQSFNVINVALPTVSASGSGSITLSENFTVVGTNGTPGSISGTLTGTFTVSGAITSYTGTITNLTGTGFTVSSVAYSLPSPGSSTGGPTSGNISFIVTPTAVPEPASMAMVGLGLAGLGGLAVRRRLVK